MEVKDQWGLDFSFIVVCCALSSGNGRTGADPSVSPDPVLSAASCCRGVESVGVMMEVLVSVPVCVTLKGTHCILKECEILSRWTNSSPATNMGFILCIDKN